MYTPEFLNSLCNQPEYNCWACKDTGFASLPGDAQQFACGWCQDVYGPDTDEPEFYDVDIRTTEPSDVEVTQHYVDQYRTYNDSDDPSDDSRILNETLGF